MSPMPEELVRPMAAVVFTGFAGLTLAGAVVAAVSRRLVRSVCGLALAFLGLSGLYYFLHSPFLALMQILIYVGAVCVVIMFALMLAEPQGDGVPVRRPAWREAGGLLIAGLLALALLTLAGRSAWMPPAARPGSVAVKELGRELLHRYGFAFELVSLLLFLAILGALVVARSGRRSGP